MRYAPRTLRHELKTRDRLPFDECLRIGLALAGALEHLHQHGLVHRDVKPSNVIFVEGIPKLADIGLVAGVDEARSFVGTEGYIPPEGPGKPQADLYSLGIVLYVMSTGNRHDAFPEPRADLASDPDQARWLELNAIIHQACHADPRQRYPSATAMRADLELLQRGQSVRRKQRATARWRVLSWVGAAVAVVALLAVALNAWPQRATSRADSGTGLPAARASVFVLPFRSPPGDSASGELASRVTDGLIDSLEILLGKERMGPRKSGWLLKSEEGARRLAFEQFSPEHAVAGQVIVTNGRVEVALSEYPARQASAAWQERVAGATNDLVALEWAVVERATQRLGVEIPEAARTRVLGVLSNNVAALEYCRRGEALAAVYSVDRLTQARSAFHRAKTLDPNCLRALDGLLWVNRCIVWHRSHRESWLEVLSLSRDILRIDDSSWSAHYWLACGRLHYDWDFSQEAVDGFRAVLRALPHNEEYFCNLALLDRSLGRFAEARKFQALQDQQRSEHGPFLWLTITAKYLDARYAEIYEGKRDTASRYDEVIAGGRFIQQQDPEHNTGYWMEALGYVGKRDYRTAIEVLQKGRAVYESQEIIGLQGYAHARLGNRAAAEESLRLLRVQPFTHSYWVARIHAALGEPDQALEWLQKAVEDRSEFLVTPDFGSGGLWLDEAWDQLRSDPRFQRIKAATGLRWPGDAE